jgi:hypothetical protein
MRPNSEDLNTALIFWFFCIKAKEQQRSNARQRAESVFYPIQFPQPPHRFYQRRIRHHDDLNPDALSGKN